MSLHTAEWGDMRGLVCRPAEEHRATEGLEDVAWQGCEGRQGQVIESPCTSLWSDMQG
jgi:hypothetical protein